MGRTEAGAEAFAERLETYLASALSAEAPAETHADAVHGVPGARVVRKALREEECAALEALVREVHGKSVGKHREDGHQSRRQSQHHVALQVADEAVARLGKRLRPWLDAEAGPKNPRPLEPEGAELSSFLRTYCYQEGDASTPHFDKAFTEHVGKGSADQHLVRFSAFSVVMYLNEGFEGGETTFFCPDPAIKPSRRGNTPIIEDTSVLRVAGANVPRRGDILVFPHGSMPGSYPNPLHEGSVLRRGSNKPEFESRLPSSVYWSLFRIQRAARPEAPKVLVVSALGLERELSRDDLARALVDELPSEHPLAFISASEDGSGKLTMSSKTYVARQGAQGQVMCVKCGAFVRAATGGLEWHLKTAHGVETHQVAFEAVQRQSDALFALRSAPDLAPFAAAAASTSDVQRLDPDDVARAIRERASLDASVAAGRIRSLGPELDACRSGDLEALRKAVAAGWDAHAAVDRNGANGLLWAAGFGNLEVCKFLVHECKLDPVNASQKARRGYSMRTALHWAARNGHMDVVRWLVEDQASPADAVTGDGTTPLCFAAWQGHVEVCKYLIEKAGASPATSNSFGCNLAMWVAQSPQHESALTLCDYLLERGVDFTRINHNGQGCLHKAAQRGNRAVCEWLLRKAGLGPEHFAPNENEKSRPSELAKFAGHDALSSYLSLQESTE
ncbi:Ankyrin repeat domain-containing protein 17 [Hondaea fermentalgiana]|uniref:Ankyrin repeat domain-containing protein 17 n=1 Tax=Hondaea fermentalgiana TaxID=2315210 RepID=A0A2R5GK30_9STRA|nr:Ankyrin repeat domain-containing protein 17 [Hondaea fermentalgiana]|eukprot:GBG31240.1 Ankyrin repeat domain-containing protein 17 [Hondaea fermentalgiana]